MSSVHWFHEIVSSKLPVLIATHENPDGDCLGSALALALALKNNGVSVSVVNKDPIPENYLYLAGSQDILLPASLNANFETVIVVDCTDLDRLGFDLGQICNNIKQIINIDHHVSNTYFGKYNHVEPNVSATGEIIYKILEEVAVPITPEIATALYTALVTDSGSFQYESTSPETLLIASKLLACGADLGLIRKNLWENTSLKSIKVLQLALNSLELTAQGKLAWISLKKEQLEAIGATSQDLEGLVNYPRSIAGVEVGILFKEVEHQTVRVSFRSKEYFDVNVLAKAFGGGGHKRAAGCTIKAPLEEAIKEVTSTAEKMLVEVKR